MFRHFSILFLLVDAPCCRTPLYARWMKQVKRPLQLSDSCRPLSYIHTWWTHSRHTCTQTYAMVHTHTTRDQWIARRVETHFLFGARATRTMRDERGRGSITGITELVAHHFIPFLRFCDPPCCESRYICPVPEYASARWSVGRIRVRSNCRFVAWTFSERLCGSTEKLARINIRLSVETRLGTGFLFPRRPPIPRSGLSKVEMSRKEGGL